MPAPGYGGKKCLLLIGGKYNQRCLEVSEGTWPWARSYEETAEGEGWEDDAGLVAKRPKGKRAGLAKMSEFYMGEQLGEGQTSLWAGEFRVVGGLCWPGGPYYK